jgi:hypothetical protein
MPARCTHTRPQVDALVHTPDDWYESDPDDDLTRDRSQQALGVVPGGMLRDRLGEPPWSAPTDARWRDRLAASMVNARLPFMYSTSAVGVCTATDRTHAASHNMTSLLGIERTPHHIT